MTFDSKPVFAALLLLTPGALTHATSASADTYHRFWRGTKLPTLSTADFVADLNEVFLPATVRIGAGNGMIAYQPVLTGGGAAGALPDEIALVSYKDLATYNTLYATAPGKAYQDLHWQYFDRSMSHSLTPAPFAGAVGLEQAYDLHPEYAEWQGHVTTVLIDYRRAGETDAAYLARVGAALAADFARDADSGVLDRAVLVAEGYWVEYVSGTGAPWDAGAADAVLAVPSARAGDGVLREGAGVNLLGVGENR